jgi:hypothetical protein
MPPADKPSPTQQPADMRRTPVASSNSRNSTRCIYPHVIPPELGQTRGTLHEPEPLAGRTERTRAKSIAKAGGQAHGRGVAMSGLRFVRQAESYVAGQYPYPSVDPMGGSELGGRILRSRALAIVDRGLGWRLRT